MLLLPIALLRVAHNTETDEYIIAAAGTAARNLGIDIKQQVLSK